MLSRELAGFFHDLEDAASGFNAPRQRDEGDETEVFWPVTDKTQVFHNVGVDQLVEITEGQNELRGVPRPVRKFHKEKQVAVTRK